MIKILGKRAIREEGEATDSLARNEAILARYL